MTDLMQVLFNYLEEKRIQAFLPKHCPGILLEDREDALVATFDDAQRRLWEQWRTAQMDYEIMYEQALFQAALALCQELK